MSVIIGVDPGSRFAGYGVVELKKGQQKVLHLEHGVFKLPLKAALPQRLDQLAHDLNFLIREYQPETMVLEGIFLGKNVQSVFQLGHVRGVCMQQAARAKVQLAEYAARSVKKAVTGNGGASKEHVRMVVLNELAMRSQAKLDATDALALCLCHIREIEKQRVLQQFSKGVQL